MVRELSNRVEELTSSMSTTMPPVPRPIDREIEPFGFVPLLEADRPPSHWSAGRQFGRGRIGGGPRALGIAPDDKV